MSSSNPKTGAGLETRPGSISTTWDEATQAIEVLVRFKISSTSRSCEEIAQHVGIKPSVSGKIGDPIGRSKLTRKANECLYESKLPRTAPLDEHVRDLLAQLEPARSRISTLPDMDCTVLFSCVVYSSERPELYFDSEMIASIAGLRCDFDIDLFILPEAEEDRRD